MIGPAAEVITSRPRLRRKRRSDYKIEAGETVRAALAMQPPSPVTSRATRPKLACPEQLDGGIIAPAQRPQPWNCAFQCAQGGSTADARTVSRDAEKRSAIDRGKRACDCLCATETTAQPRVAPSVRSFAAWCRDMVSQARGTAIASDRNDCMNSTPYPETHVVSRLHDERYSAVKASESGPLNGLTSELQAMLLTVCCFVMCVHASPQVILRLTYCVVSLHLAGSREPHEKTHSDSQRVPCDRDQPVQSSCDALVPSVGNLSDGEGYRDEELNVVQSSEEESDATSSASDEDILLGERMEGCGTLNRNPLSGKLWTNRQFPEGYKGHARWDLANITAAQAWSCPCKDRRNCIGEERISPIALAIHRKEFQTRLSSKQGDMRDSTRESLAQHYSAITGQFSRSFVVGELNDCCAASRGLADGLSWNTWSKARTDLRKNRPLHKGRCKAREERQSDARRCIEAYIRELCESMEGSKGGSRGSGKVYTGKSSLRQVRMVSS